MHSLSRVRFIIRSSRTPILTAGLVLALAACGDDSRPAVDSGSPTDLGMGVDMGTGADLGTPGDMGVAGDLGSTDLGMSGDMGGGGDGGVRSGYAAADRARERAECVCDPASLVDYSSPDACAGARLAGVANDACVDAAVIAGGAESVTYYACLTSALQTFSACLSAAGGCADAARTACEDPYFAATDLCVFPTDTTAYDTALLACEATMLVGTGASTCSDTAAASTALGDSVFSGTTLLAGDHRGGTGSTCGSTSDPVPDVTHRWTATVAGMYRIDLFGSSFDTVLRTFPTCAPDAVEICNDDGYADGLISQLTLTFTAGQSVQIVVDGFGPDDAGDYKVNIHAM